MQCTEHQSGTAGQKQQPSRSNLRALVGLNIALLIVLGAVTFGAAVNAQARGRGEYTMVAGGVPGADADAIYITDVANQEMIVMVFNHQTKTLDGVAYRNLAADTASVIRGRTRPGN